ncbi:NUDIX domain-containing protein [bacterium]|nr:NUDIX domain-containing protein [bacterium]
MAKRSVAGIAVREGRILVAKRVEGGPIGLRWEFPGGKVEEGESDEAALVREFDEELGIAVRPLRRIGEGSFDSPSGRRQLAAWLVELPPGSAFQLREHSDIAWVDALALEAIDLADSDRRLLPLLRGEVLAGA